jgi:microcystin-dependent protein
VPGQIIVTAGQQAPPYTLLCNGAAISRTQYTDLFAAIGTTYGAGDGVTTFNVPRLGEGTVIKATVDASKIGTYSAGALLTHSHGASSAEAGDHGHSVSLAPGGNHSHGASASGVGDHAHSAWTDGQGLHAHSGQTGGQSADHSHTAPSVFHVPGSNAQYTGGGGNRFDASNLVTTGSSNDHSHSFGTDWQGNHGHNIGMNGAGNHTHTISIAAVGDHTHGLSLANNGSHSHTITIAAAGGSDNLAAGTHMFHFIAY